MDGETLVRSGRPEAIIAGIVAAAGIALLVAVIGLQVKKQQSANQEVGISTPGPTTTATASGSTDGTSVSAQPATLAGTDPRARINIRAQPSTQSSIVYQAWVGDRVTVLKEASGADGSRWYYVKLNTANTEGWVHSSLLSFDTSTAQQPTDSAAPIATVLQSCKSWVSKDIGNAQVQVYPNPRFNNGIYTVAWSANNGADGYCRIDRNGSVIEYVNYAANRPPTDPSIPSNAALQACQQRAQQALPNTTITVNPDSRLGDGTFIVHWRANTGTDGYCRVTRDGSVLEFVNYYAVSEPTQVALNRCKQRAEQQFPGARVEVLLDPRDRTGAFRVNWLTSTGASGVCRVDRDGQIITFDNNAPSDPSAREARRAELQQEFQTQFLNQDITQVKTTLRQQGYAPNDNGAGQVTFRADRGTFQVLLNYKLGNFAVNSIQVL